MKTSRFALAAAAGLFVLGAYAQTPAKAADLGGNCCADLEERVAELEATTVRKGNRVVSVQLYGQVNKDLLIWDDGLDSDTYVVDNDFSSSRFGLVGKGTLMPGWSAGFRAEFEFQSAASNLVSQFFDGDPDINQSQDIFRVRKTVAYVQSEQFGRVSLGLQSTATDGIAEINLAETFNDGSNYYSSGFFLRTPNGVYNKTFIGDLTWGDITDDVDGPRADVIRYDTPSIYGFILSASWGENDFWDVALRFAKEWNSIRIAAGIGYAEDQEIESTPQMLSGSISVMHIPTGLFATFMAGQTSFDRVFTSYDDCHALAPAGGAKVDANGYCALKSTGEPLGTPGAPWLWYYLPDNSFYYGQLGIEKNWSGFGATTVYGAYGHYDDWGAGVVVDAGIGAEGYGWSTFLKSSGVDRWGLGVVQQFDSAALELYGLFDYYSADVRTVTFSNNPADAVVYHSPSVEDWYGFVLGTRIKF